MVSRTCLGLLERVGAHFGLVGVAAEPEGDRPHAGEPRVPVEDPGERVFEGGAVVDPGAHDDLAVYFDPPVQEDLQPTQTGRPLGIPQHLRPQFRICRVDRHEQRPQSLGQDALRIELGETGQCREVPVQERQSIVVVLEVQTPTHALGQLVDEAEGTVIVAGPDPIEDRGGDFHAHRLASVLVDPHDARQRRAGAANEDAEVTRVGEALKIDDVARLLPINAEELVAHGQTGPGCRRRRGDRSHRGS